jgi:Uma2 family endonuclease
MSSERKTHLTAEEYLALERKSQVRSEYLDGDMVAMSGGSREHNLIVANVVRELTTMLKGRPCEVYPSNMRVKVSATGLYTYPDVVVVCGEPQFEDAHVDTLINPTAVIEVLSDSTESYDRGIKFGHYRKVESLIEYVLMAQHEYRIEQFVRQPEGQWLRSQLTGLKGSLEVPSIQCSIDLSEIYDKVKIGSSGSRTV